MGKQRSSQIKKTIGILLAFCFMLSITVALVSADQADYDKGYIAGYTAGYSTGFEQCKKDQPATPPHNIMALTQSDYSDGYSAGYDVGFQKGYAACGPNPVADFSASPTSGTAPLKVKFTDQSTENPVTWQWNFGDGKTSIDQNPTHTYVSDGTYTVKLTVKNKTGSDTVTYYDYIKVKP
jgi:PKD repeat protein